MRDEVLGRLADAWKETNLSHSLLFAIGLLTLMLRIPQITDTKYYEDNGMYFSILLAVFLALAISRFALAFDKKLLPTTRTVDYRSAVDYFYALSLYLSNIVEWALLLHLFISGAYQMGEAIYLAASAVSSIIIYDLRGRGAIAF